MATERFNPETAPDDDDLHFYAMPERSLAWVVGCVLTFLIAALAVLATWLFISLVPLRPALARDDGRYANDPLKPWFDALQSGKGLCCSFADGFSIKDVDWDTQCATIAGQEQCGYRVRIDGKWFDVPPDAVINTANKYGPAVVWPYKDSNGETLIRCFLPGAGA